MLSRTGNTLSDPALCRSAGTGTARKPCRAGEHRSRRRGSGCACGASASTRRRALPPVILLALVMAKPCQIARCSAGARRCCASLPCLRLVMKCPISAVLMLQPASIALRASVGQCRKLSSPVTRTACSPLVGCCTRHMCGGGSCRRPCCYARRSGRSSGLGRRRCRRRLQCPVRKQRCVPCSSLIQRSSGLWWHVCSM